MDSYRTELFFIAFAAALAPLFARIPTQFRMPLVVVEILLGMIIGPQVLNLASSDGLVAMLGELGLTFLLFMVGLEINLDHLKGNLLTLAASGWLLSFSLAMISMAFFHNIGLLQMPPVLAAVALSTTALGIVGPILKDSNRVDSNFGRALLGAAAMGEFAPLMVLSFVLIPVHGTVWHTILVVAFVAISILVADTAIRVRTSALMDRISETMRRRDQLPVRICIAVQALLVALAARFGINVVFGAFAAGLIVNLLARQTQTGGTLLRQDLNAIGYGFLIPFFFIAAGMRFDIRDLWSTPLVPVQITGLLILLLLVRGLPVLLYRKLLAPEERLPFAFYSATGLPLIVIISEIGVASGLMSEDRAMVLVSAGMISVLVFPMVAQSLLDERR
ncbi:MAG: cation:proton antiporter [Gammaproteobacteria bacterium]